MPESPSTTGEMLPRKLYLAEFLMLPFFWFGPLLALVLGGTIALDLRDLADYDVSFGDSRYIWYFAPFVLGHLGSFGYRMNRRKAVRHHLGLTPTEMSHLMGKLDPPKGTGVRGLFALQLLATVAVLALPDSAVGVAALLLYAFTLLAAPFAVWLDLRAVREIPEIRWGWPRYLHVVLSVLPFVLFVYLAQRQEHLYYAVFVRVWDADLSGLTVPAEEHSTLARLADRIDEIAP